MQVEELRQKLSHALGNALYERKRAKEYEDWFKMEKLAREEMGRKNRLLEKELDNKRKQCESEVKSFPSPPDAENLESNYKESAKIMNEN